MFFGHYDTVVMLLKYGLSFTLNQLKASQIKENLFKILTHGYVNSDDTYKKKSKSLRWNFITDWYSDLVTDNTIFRNDLYNYGNDHQNIAKLIVRYEVKQDVWTTSLTNLTIDPYHSELYFDIEILTYFIQNGMDINKIAKSNYFNEEITGRSLLEGSIIFMKLDVIEFLLQLHNINKTISNIKAIKTINNNEQIKILLLKYGVNILT